MNIAVLTRDLINRYYQSVGVQPTKLYLGKAEVAALKIFCRPHQTTAPESNVMYFMGLLVVEVKAIPCFDVGGGL